MSKFWFVLRLNVPFCHNVQMFSQSLWAEADTEQNFRQTSLEKVTIFMFSSQESAGSVGPGDKRPHSEIKITQKQLRTF